ncbi:hypothetical protein MHH52_28380 [Paenibacillus sp. FSL K6-0276]
MIPLHCCTPAICMGIGRALTVSRAGRSLAPPNMPRTLGIRINMYG